MQKKLPVAPREPQFEIQEGQSPLIPQAIIVDLDSTLALLGDRNPHNYEEVMQDKINEVIYRLVMKYKKDGYHILIVTGRPKTCAMDTIEWMNMNHVPFDVLLMRDIGDKQPDYTLKHRMYNQYIKDKYDVEFVLEDRDRVVKRWREIGLTCLQVREGNY